MIVPGSLNPNLLGASSAPATVQQTATTNSVTAASPAVLSTGTAHPSRHIIVAAGAYGNAHVPTSMTIDGNSMTSFAPCPGTVLGAADFHILHWPTGTTATFDITTSGQLGRAYKVFAAYNLKSTTPLQNVPMGDGASTNPAITFATLAGSPNPPPLVIPRGGFMLACMIGWTNIAGVFNVAWTPDPGGTGITDLSANGLGGTGSGIDAALYNNSGSSLNLGLVGTMNNTPLFGRRGGVALVMR